MSKLSEMILAAQTNERRYVFTPLIKLASSVVPEPHLTYPDHYVYSFKAEFGCNATVQYGAKSELETKLKVIRRQVVEEVFGEFRDDIYAIQRALMDYNTDQASELVSAMHDRMFNV
jgi:hypothetical protein